MTLSKEYLLSVCEVKTMSNEMLATGTLREINDEFIEIAAKVGWMPIAEYRTPVKINIFNIKQGFRVMAGEVYTSSQQSIRIMNLIALVDYERRHFFRVDTNIRTRIYPILRGGEVSDQEIPIQISNLSLCGAGMVTEQELDVKRSYLLKLRLMQKVCNIALEVVRTEDSQGEGFHYGCQFTKIKSVDEDILCAFIFEMQREQINRQRETR